jgi:diadenosine tetraphosphate (Ap4A) HIT family hydrolase
MCDPEEYCFLAWGNRRVCRLVDENDKCYVIVPRESHLEHHLLVVLKPAAGQHKGGLIECTFSDISNLGKAISKWAGVLKTMGYDTVYAGCFSDEGHVHFHLFPFRFHIDKEKRGKALQWLAKKEQQSEAHCFSKLTEKQKESRMDKIEAMVAELLKAKESLCGKGILSVDPKPIERK